MKILTKLASLEELSQKDVRILETEDNISTANNEIEEEKKARNLAEEEVRRLKKEHEKINKKYLHYKQQSSNQDLELKKKDIEIERLNKTQKTSEELEENRTPKKAVRRLNNSNPPQCGPPQCGLLQNNDENPPQCGPPQCGKQQTFRTESEPETGPEDNIPSGYGLNSGLTPIGTPKRSQGSQGKRTHSQD